MQWIAKDKADPNKVQTLVQELNAPEVIAEILCQRGIDSEEKLRAFFNPRIGDLHDPFLMKDMEAAVERIEAAISLQEGVLIFGDYDVDGTTAVSLVYSFFQPYLQQCEYYIPDRYNEGYGISKEGIDYAASKSMDLIIALDCGIRSVELVNYASELGIDFIICDHHLPGVSLPAAIAVLDPKREDCAYPYKELSGCGIGFKLCEAYAQKNDLDPNTYLQYLDLLALSIASDIVPITGENRILAYFGLKVINEQAGTGMSALKSIAIQKETLGIGDLVFYLGPRINAAGRLSKGTKAVALLIEEDWNKATELAQELHQLNADRRQVDESITGDLKRIVQQQPELLNNTTLVFYDPSWHKGVIGIAASRAVEMFYKPTVVLTGSDGVLTGSARSISGFDVHEALIDCSDHLLQFGGHTYAAGMSLREDSFDAFKMAFETVGQRKISEEDLIPKLYYDAFLDLDLVNDKFHHILQKMAPFGPSNRQPVFMAKAIELAADPQLMGKTKDHIRLNFQREFDRITAVGFNMAVKLPSIKEADTLDVCFQINENIFNGRRSLQLMLKDLKPTSDSGIASS